MSEHEFIADLKSRLTPDKEDDVTNFLTPNKPSHFRALTDAELFLMLQKCAFANDWSLDAKVQFEATGRLIAALTDFKRSSDRASSALIRLTVVLIVLTAALVGLTVALLWLTAQLD